MVRKIILLLLLFLFVAGCSLKKSGFAYDEVSFKWDFSKKRTFIYQIEATRLEVSRQDLSSGQFNDDSITSVIIGELHIESNGKHEAKMSLKNITVESDEIVHDKLGEQADSIERNPSYTLTEDGIITDEWAMFSHELIFPVPNFPLFMGEKGQIPNSLGGFNMGDTFILGLDSLEFNGYSKMRIGSCAILSGSTGYTEIDSMGQIEESGLGYKCSYYFDHENHYFFGSDIEGSQYMVVGENGELKAIFYYSVSLKVRLIDIVD